MASTHHWELSMSLKVSNIVSQIHCKDFDNKKIFIFHLGGSEYFFSDSDTPTEGSSDNESYINEKRQFDPNSENGHISKNG